MNKILHSLLWHFGFLFSDKAYLKAHYRLKFGRNLDLKNPQTFSEKLQWLKLYDRKPEYTTMVDKYTAKKYVADIIGDEFIIPTLGVWDKAEDIEWESLPDRFVLKATNGSGGQDVIICKDKSKLDREAAVRKLNASLKKNVYSQLREWPYKNVKPRVLAEEYMEDTKTHELRDYKFFCMDGVCNALFIATDRFNRKEPYFDFFDTSFRHLDIQQGHPNAPVPPAKPETFEKMKQMAAKISEGLPEARVDFYEVNGKAYFGEITFFHFSGMVPFHPDSVDKEWGEWITLPKGTGGGKLLITSGIVLWLHEEEPTSLQDYKIHCFNNGKKMILVCKDRYKTTGLTEDFYDEDWNHLSVRRPAHPNASTPIAKPDILNQMLQLADKLSQGIPFVRVDFYEVNGKVSFGELTFYPASGLARFEPDEWDYTLGSWLKLSVV